MGDSLRLLVVGDSLTGGMFAADRASRFVSLVVEHLERERPVELVVAATAGGTTRVCSIVDLPESAEVAVVELGTNDSLKTLPWVFARQYDDLLARIRATSPHARIVCLGVWRERWRGGVYDAAIKRVAARHGATFRPLSDVHADPATRGPAGVPTWQGVSDTFHPNSVGHGRIAERVIDALA